MFAVSDDVSIEGKTLPAGRYGLHMIAGPEEWVLIFSKDADAWGSFYYEPAHDALRVTVKPRKHEYREWLTYEFTTRRPSEAVAELQWEDLAVPWTIEVPNINDLYISKITANLTNVQGFGWRGWVAASQFCLAENTHLEQALEWAEIAVSRQFIGEANFTTLSNKAQVLEKLGRKQEADASMQLAVRHSSATPIDLHQYGRKLLAEKRDREALEIFKLNFDRHGDQWPTPRRTRSRLRREWRSETGSGACPKSARAGARPGESPKPGSHDCGARRRPPHRAVILSPSDWPPQPPGGGQNTACDPCWVASKTVTHLFSIT